MLKIKVRRNTKPILTPEEYKEEYTSIRNPGAIKYKGNYLLLVTTRSLQDRKMRLHLARSKDGKNFKIDKEPFIDVGKNAIAGVEDARITKINSTYYILFTAFDGRNNQDEIIVRIGILKTKDFKKYSGRKILLKNFGKNKNGVLFKNNDFYYVCHRPFGKKIRSHAAQIARSKDLKTFENLGTLIPPRQKMWDDARVGINTPPIKIKTKEHGECLFTLYHGASKKKNIYRIGYILLDKDDPERVLERSTKPLLYPKYTWEKVGEVPNVIFGCGMIPLSKKKLRFYYGAADSYISYADLTLEDAEIVEE